MPDQNQDSGIAQVTHVPAFAPDDPTDGRSLLDWKSKYPKEAWRIIWIEAVYLFILLILPPILMLLFWLELPNRWFKLTDEKYRTVVTYTLAWFGGVLGGTLFDIKWLYHAVARQVWHLDRRLWRILTPHISGGLAFAMVALISSGLPVFDREATQSRALVVGMAILVGYFSDSAVAKLSEIAETLFGASRGREKHKATSSKQGPPAAQTSNTQTPVKPGDNAP